MPFTGYRVTSEFGWRNHPIRGEREWHTGIDLVKAHRAPIQAFTEGEVLFAGVGKTGTGLGGYGNVVLVKDKNNRGQLYAHLDSISVQKGEEIRRGQEIGKQGATGQVAGSHLHYEVRIRAQASPPYGREADRANNCLNPRSYLQEYDGASGSQGNVLRKGSKGEAVRQLQNKLLAIGEKLPGHGAKGVFGSETEAAVRSFQKGIDMKIDGIVGPRTETELDRFLPKYTRILRNQIPMKNGNDVKAVQRVTGAVDDGFFGLQTEGAVRTYQQLSKLTVDGVVGPKTWRHMFGK